MALKKIIELEGNSFLDTSYGIVKTGKNAVSVSAYIKIASIRGSKSNLNAEVNFSSKDIEFTKSYSMPVSTEDNSANFIKQAYEHLKTLPEFENSEDC
jgi:hypothetical protein